MLTQSERTWPHRGAIIVLRRYDAYGVWTWLALFALTGAVVLARVGVPGVDLHGPLHYLGIMDPLCGGTRSVYLTLQGRLWDAVHYNPAAPLLLVAAVLALSRSVIGHTTGHWAHLRMPRRRLTIAATVVAVIALEVNQQSHAALLMAPWSGV